MKAHKKGIVRIVAATLAAASLLFTAACAGGTGSSSASSASTDLKVGLTASPGHREMAPTSGAAIPQALMVNVYEGLVKLKDDGKTIEPLLAKSWTVSEDGLTYTFKLQSGVKFSNGDSFDSSTVKYNLERLNTWKANTPSNLSAIDHVDTPSADEAKVVLKSPDRNV
ncbi:MAG: ABC transporter substrate-binding protein, partial [Bifidobacterium crudilactis]|nr:ABC transporter substrate-binding protein [Bifidobacterium crudilactis]